MNVGITGATGFIGSYLLPWLARDGALRIKAITRTLSHDVETFGGHVTWLKGDLNSSADCADFAEGLDAIIHLAHTNTPLTSNRDLVGDAQANLIPSLTLLQAVKSHGRPVHVIYSSSGGAIYGAGNAAHREPIKETDPCLPVTAYGIQKLAFESYLRMATHEGWLHATALRIGNPYGVLLPAERMQGFIGVALQRHLRGLPVRIFGNPENVRDYVHLDDVCRFFEKVVKAPQGFQVYNLSSGEGHSVNGILDIMEKVTGKEIIREISYYPESEKHLVPWIVLSVEKAARELGWTPETPLVDGLKNLYDRSIS